MNNLIATPYLVWNQYTKNSKELMKICLILNNYLLNFQHNKNQNLFIQMYMLSVCYPNNLYVHKWQIMINKLANNLNI